MKKLLLALVAVALTASAFAGRNGSCPSCPRRGCAAEACPRPVEDCPKCTITCEQKPCVVEEIKECQPECYKTVCKRVRVQPNKHVVTTYSCPAECPEIVHGKRGPSKKVYTVSPKRIEREASEEVEVKNY